MERGGAGVTSVLEQGADARAGCVRQPALLSTGSSSGQQQEGERENHRVHALVGCYLGEEAGGDTNSAEDHQYGINYSHRIPVPLPSTPFHVLANISDVSLVGTTVFKYGLNPVCLKLAKNSRDYVNQPLSSQIFRYTFTPA